MMLSAAKIIQHWSQINKYGTLVEWYWQRKNQSTWEKTWPSAT